MMKKDLAEKAGIKSNDSDFEILCKMAKLNYLNQQFVIKLKQFSNSAFNFKFFYNKINISFQGDIYVT